MKLLRPGTTRHWRSQRGEYGARAPSNWNATNDKNVTKKTIVSSVSIFFSIFCVQQYTRTAVNNNNIDNQGAGPPQFNFCLSIKINNLAEIKGSYLKVAISGSHLTFLKT